MMDEAPGFEAVHAYLDHGAFSIRCGLCSIRRGGIKCSRDSFMALQFFMSFLFRFRESAHHRNPADTETYTHSACVSRASRGATSSDASSDTPEQRRINHAHTH